MGPTTRRRHGRHSPWSRSLRTLVRILVLAFVVHLFVIPQVGGARAAFHRLTEVTPWLIVVGFAIEGAALFTYAELARRLLPPPERPPRPTCLGVVLASTAVNHVVPGGAATTASVNYRLFGRLGVSPEALSFMLVTQAVGSALVLNVILWLALLVSIPVTGFHPLYATAASVGAVLMILAASMVVAVVHGSHRVARAVSRLARPFRRVDASEVQASLDRAAARLLVLASDPKHLASNLGLAAANWLLDAAALWVCIAAFGHRPNVVGLVVAYGLANVMGAIPITPGGLGVVEAVLIPTLVGFGNPASAVAVGVVVYRLLSFWLPIPVGLVSYVVVERRTRAVEPPHGVTPVLEDLVARRAQH